ncbi:hypothetical protein GCM10027030_29790 [Luteococcus sediminum]|uniref:DNA-processing protein DprA n=1 Tax=Luteococcus sp. TaxID=1969402 RepID=UPI0037356DFF
MSTTNPETAAAPRWDAERIARACLTAVCEAGSPGLAPRVAEVGAEEVWRTLLHSTSDGRWPRRARELDVQALLDTAERHGVSFLTPGDDEWPGQVGVLDQVQVAGLGGSPVGLWVRGPGRLGSCCQRSVAVVGSRASTAYGEQVAAELSADLASGPQPWTVISGGAYGIDRAAHRGAAGAGGPTVAVLASGLDLPYPRGNHALFEMLARDHLLVSEVPCGMHPTRVGFLSRNRLVAALSTGTVVVEGAARSGANNTATWASECSRVLMAVPGPVHSSMSTTPHRLIRDHRAALVCTSQEVRALVEPLSTAPVLPIGGGPRLLDQVDPDLVALREALPGRGGIGAAVVAREAGVSLRRALAGLARLEQMGLVACDAAGEWSISAPRPLR